MSLSQERVDPDPAPPAPHIESPALAPPPLPHSVRLQPALRPTQGQHWDEGLGQAAGQRELLLYYCTAAGHNKILQSDTTRYCSQK